jgi:glyoxylase-like metal-dependent hydrolase (beta-lactamase superfamily II)
MWLWIAAGCADVTPPEDALDLGPVEQVKDWFTSVYLLRHADGVALFDAGFREGHMERALEDRGLAPSDVTDVLLTHGHDDHVGALSLFAGARVWASAEDAALVEEASGVAPTDVLEAGVPVTVGENTIEVFAVPGHTPGSVVFLVDGVLVLGDQALQNRDGEIEPVNERRSDDPEQLLAEMTALVAALEPRADEIAWLAPAHSAPVAGFGALQATFPAQ